MATSLSILISDTSGCVIFRRLSITPVSGQPWEDLQLNHLALAFLVAACFADRIVSLQPYQSPETPFPELSKHNHTTFKQFLVVASKRIP